MCLSIILGKLGLSATFSLAAQGWARDGPMVPHAASRPVYACNQPCRQRWAGQVGPGYVSMEASRAV